TVLSSYLWLFEPSAPCEAALNVVCGEPSPQSTSTDHGLSFTPASENEPRSKLCAEPSSELWFAAAVTDGARLFTITFVVYSLKPPSLSMMRAFTGYVPLSAKLQLVEALEPEPA